MLHQREEEGDPDPKERRVVHPGTSNRRGSPQLAGAPGTPEAQREPGAPGPSRDQFPGNSADGPSSMSMNPLDAPEPAGTWAELTPSPGVTQRPWGSRGAGSRALAPAASSGRLQAQAVPSPQRPGSPDPHSSFRRGSRKGHGQQCSLQVGKLRVCVPVPTGTHRGSAGQVGAAQPARRLPPGERAGRRQRARQAAPRSDSENRTQHASG